MKLVSKVAWQYNIMVTLNLYISVGFLNEIVKQENCTLNIIIDIRETKKAAL